MDAFGFVMTCTGCCNPKGSGVNCAVPIVFHCTPDVDEPFTLYAGAVTARTRSQSCVFLRFLSRVK